VNVNCEGCAGCCVDWRPLAPEAADDRGRRGPHRPLDGVHNLVPLTRDEVARFVDSGLGDALTPRLWRAEGERSTVVGGVRVAAVDGRPAFFVGLRKPRKPVAPMGADRTWLDACAFLDPDTLMCRIHGDDRYPAECADYPGHNLELGVDSECERVERAFPDGERRLLDAEPPAGTTGLLLGPQALGGKLFVHPDPERVADAVGRAAAGETTPADRAAFVGVAVGSRPGSLEVDADRAREARERVLSADSWVGRAVSRWRERAGGAGEAAGDAPTGAAVEEREGAPPTTGWDAVGDGGGDKR
jgi:Fe-S-cluster containining protein